MQATTEQSTITPEALDALAEAAQRAEGWAGEPFLRPNEDPATGLAPGTDPREVEDRLVKFTPPEFLKNAHHWLILHGRYVCIARKPGCPECLIRDLCEYREKTKA